MQVFFFLRDFSSLLNKLLLKLKPPIIGSVFMLCVCVFQGVRDLLKDVVDKIQTIPTTVSSAIVQQLLAAREVQCFPIVHLWSVIICDLFISLGSLVWIIIWKHTKSITLMFYSVRIPGGRVYPGQKCLPPASLFCRHRNQETVPRGTAVTLG